MKQPSVWASLAPIVFLIVELFFVVRFFGADAMDGASQLALILAAGLGIAVSMLVCKNSWHNLETAILDNIRSIGSAVLILLLIGMISGSWMISGIVPMMISGGLKVLTPKLFLLAGCPARMPQAAKRLQQAFSSPMRLWWTSALTADGAE